MSSDDDDYFYSDFSDSDDDEPDSRPAWKADSASDTAPLLNSGIARLFAESMEAGLPPKYLRPLLAQIHWQLVAHPGNTIQSHALAQGRDFGGKKQKRKTRLAESLVACFVVHETAQPDTVLAHEHLSDLRTKRTVDAVLLQYQAQWYGFTSEQFIALEEYLSQQAVLRDTEEKEVWRLELITGAGSLAEFLSMPVQAPEGLPTTGGLRGSSMGTIQSKVICINTPGFQRGYLSEEKRITMRETLSALAERTDYDGIQFNTTATGDSCFHMVGPNFAQAVLASSDLRRPPRCPAEPIHRFEYALYLTRPFSDLKSYGRKEVEMALEGARFLLSAIPPELDTLPRDAVQSLFGAFYLRCKPEFTRRKWLEDFIRRCDRALAARWRVGIF